MFIRFNDADSGAIRHINSGNIIEIKTYPSTQQHEYFDEEYNEVRTRRAQPTRVEITTTGTHGHYEDGGDYGGSAGVPEIYKIPLVGAAAEDFIGRVSQIDSGRFEEGR